MRNRHFYHKQPIFSPKQKLYPPFANFSVQNPYNYVFLYIIITLIYNMIKQEVQQPQYTHLIQKEKVKYQNITVEQRKALIKMVIQYNNSIYRACRILGINNSTAKVIIRRYKKNGDFVMKKSEANEKPFKIEQSPEYFINPNCPTSVEKTSFFEQEECKKELSNEMWTFDHIKSKQQVPLTSNIYVYPMQYVQ